MELTTVDRVRFSLGLFSRFLIFVLGDGHFPSPWDGEPVSEIMFVKSSYREETRFLYWEMLIMKRVLLLTAVLSMTVATVGCRSCSWFRGAFADEPLPTTVMAPPVCDPCCTPACAPCDVGTCAPVMSAPCTTCTGG